MNGRPVGTAGAVAPTAAEAVHGPAWCEGAAGVALAIADSPHAMKDPALSGWLADRVHEAVSYTHYKRQLPAARSAWIRRAGALLASADRADPRCGTPGRVPHPGLLTGLSGIGHGLLRAGFPERIGSALLLRPSRAP